MQGAQALCISFGDSGHSIELAQVAPFKFFKPRGHRMQKQAFQRVGRAPGKHLPDGVFHVVRPQHQGRHPEIDPVLATQQLGVPSHERAFHLYDVDVIGS